MLMVADLSIWCVGVELNRTAPKIYGSWNLILSKPDYLVFWTKLNIFYTIFFPFSLSLSLSHLNFHANIVHCASQSEKEEKTTQKINNQPSHIIVNEQTESKIKTQISAAERR